MPPMLLTTIGPFSSVLTGDAEPPHPATASPSASRRATRLMRPTIPRQLALVASLDLAGQLLDGGQRMLHSLGERRAAFTERLLEPARRFAEPVEILGRSHTGRRPDRTLQVLDGLLGLFDPGRSLRH